MNRLLNHLRPQAETFTEEELDQQDAAAKADRIREHREHVRNGPVKTRPFTSGQRRRLVERDRQAQHRKVNRRHRRQWMATQQVNATLRGHLIVLGIVECQEGSTFTPTQYQCSLEWVIGKFAARDESGALKPFNDDTVSEAVTAARAAFLEAAGVSA